MLIGVLDEAGGEGEPAPSLHKEENEEEGAVLVKSDASEEDEGNEATAPPTVEAAENPHVEETPMESSIEEADLVHPAPKDAALTNPFLKSVLDEMPPTPRHSTPLQIALEEIHPSKEDGEDHSLTSPTERKEEGVHLPTEVCEFPVVPGDSSGNIETPENGNSAKFSV